MLTLVGDGQTLANCDLYLWRTQKTIEFDGPSLLLKILLKSSLTPCQKTHKLILSPAFYITLPINQVFTILACSTNLSSHGASVTSLKDWFFFPKINHPIIFFVHMLLQFSFYNSNCYSISSYGFAIQKCYTFSRNDFSCDEHVLVIVGFVHFCWAGFSRNEQDICSSVFSILEWDNQSLAWRRLYQQQVNYFRLYYCHDANIYFEIGSHDHHTTFYVLRERDLLLIPSNKGSLRLVQWPLFLLSSKVRHVKFYWNNYS